ncbi:choice-of-anchor Q domain-containing protein [Pseudomonas borbori]
MKPLITGRLAALMTMLTVTSAFAIEPLQVNVTADEFDGLCDAHCSLRDAIETANRAPTAQHILLPKGVIRLTRPSVPDTNGFPGDEDSNLDGDFDVRGQLTIQGRGNQHTRIVAESGSRLFEVLAGANLSLLRLSLEGGRSAGTGGALENHGEALLREVLLTDNLAMTPHSDGNPPPAEEGFAWGQGGAIANYGKLLVHASVFNDNRAQTLDWNNNLARGGAIFNLGDLLVRDSHFDWNRADEQGERGHGGAIYNRGTADIARTLFTRNLHGELGSGGALFNTEQGVLKVSNSTLKSNINAVYNGYEEFPAKITAVAKLNNVTIAESVGPGLSNTGDVLVRNSLFVANYDPFELEFPYDCATGSSGSRFRAFGLLTTSPESTCEADLYEQPARVFTHLIEPLADNGGFNHSYALRPGSMALDAGVGACSGHDQRRHLRVVDRTADGTTGCDLGAYELGAP